MAITFSSGMRITPARLNALIPLAPYKTADEDVTSSTTMQDDDHLLVTLEANARYNFLGVYIFTGDNTGNGEFTCRYTFPSGASLYIGGAGIGNAATTSAVQDGDWAALSEQTSSPSASFFGYGTIGTTAPVTAVHAGTVVTGGTGGTMRLQWAQRLASATRTRLHKGSNWTLWRVS